MTAPASPTTIAFARRRRIAGGLLAVAIAVGLGAHAWLPGGAASDISGDVLYAVVAYLAVGLIAPRLPPLAVAGAFAVDAIVASARHR